MGEKKNYICRNPACGASFSSPLKTLNLQGNNQEPYFACPVCLFEVEEANLKIQENPAQEPQEKHWQPEQKPAACRFHLGYLSERTQKDQIPDDCLTCTDIVECMLRKMRDV